MSHPKIIQGGMGAGVSDWRLARSVSVTGSLGVVSATAMDVILARRLQDGDEAGHMRRAALQFPDQEMVQRVFDKYYVEGGIKDGAYAQVPMYRIDPPKELMELSIIANFIEVTLAKEGHDGLVGVNLLEKVQMPTVHALYGVMLAGADYVIVGAGIPKEIPGILDLLSEGIHWDEALDSARQEGVLEANAEWDLEGWDAAAKLVILANAVLGIDAHLDDVVREGITDLDRSLLGNTRGQNGQYRLLAQATRRSEGAFRLSVRPVRLPSEHPLGRLGRKQMGVVFHTDIYGTITAIIKESDPMPSAATMLRDLLDIYSQ